MSCNLPRSTMTAIQRLCRLKAHRNVIPKSALRLPRIVIFEGSRYSHTMGNSLPGNVPSRTKKVSIESFSGENNPEEDIDPDDAFEGSLAYNMHLPNHESENFSFDPETGILQEKEDEIKHYENVVKPKKDQLDRVKELNFGEVARDIDQHIPRDFEVSSDQSEWAYVERLLPLKVIPKLPPAPNKDGSYPSGFVAPKRKAGEFPYHVSRTRSHMLPVYTDFNREDLLITTIIGRCDGDLHQLKAELVDFLTKRYEREFMSQVAELYGKIKFRGDFEDDFKEFLLDKGF